MDASNRDICVVSTFRKHVDDCFWSETGTQTQIWSNFLFDYLKNNKYCGSKWLKVKISYNYVLTKVCPTCYSGRNWWFLTKRGYLKIR